MTWILMLLLQVEEKKIEKPAALPQVTPGQSLWFEKLQVDGAKAALAGPLSEKPSGKAGVEVADNFGEGLLATARDASGRTVARAILKKDGLAEFSHVRPLIVTSVGTLMIRDKGFPAGTSWATFAMEDGAAALDEAAEAKGKKVRRTYVVWIYGREDLVWADYDGDGKLTRMGRQQGSAALIDHTRDRKKDAKHGLWAELSVPLQTDGSRLPESAKTREKLVEAVVVTRYEGGTLWRVRHFDKDGRETKMVHLKSEPLPFDAAFDKGAASDKQAWK